MLDAAKAYLRTNLDALRERIDAGMEFVMLEPACASVFRDELVNLLPGDEVAKRLAKQTWFFDEFADRHLVHLAIRPLARHAIVHAHCHQKALIANDAGKAALAATGVEADVLDAGCCGMAGSFGFDRDKAEISVAIGERVLLPAVRGASADTLVIADGFSCREQIAQTTGREALHLAQVLRMALPDDAAPRPASVRGAITR
jgi:Fe-S oxidoreductase